MNLQKMMQQAQQMQTKMAEMQARLEQEESEGSSGGGMVNVRLNGKHQMLKIAIDATIIKADDKEMLEDLIVAAYNDAKAKVDNNASSKMSELTSGLSLPPGMKLPF